MTLSIRRKLTYWYIGTVSALLFALIGADMVGLRRNLLLHTDQSMTSAAEETAKAIRSLPPEGKKNETLGALVRDIAQSLLGTERVWVNLRPAGNDASPAIVDFGLNGATRIEDPSASFHADKAVLDNIRSAAGEPFRRITRTVPDASGAAYKLTIAVSVENQMNAWQRAMGEHTLLAFFWIGFVSLAGSIFIRRAFSPVGRLVRTARHITADDLSQRLADPGDPDEIGELARTLNEMIARLELSFEQMTAFTGNAAHELNTPLAALKGELEVTLRRERTPEEYRETLRRLLRDLARLQGLVDNLLLLTRLDARDVRQTFAPVALDRIVLEAYEDFARIAADRGVRVDFSDLDEVRTVGDESLLKRLITNLIDNAVKYSKPDGAVSVSLLAEDSHATLHVSDTGQGIPPEDLPHVFERFFRVDKSRTNVTGGAGLGLAIVKEIADQHGATIEIASELSKGTTVTVRFNRV